MTATDYADASVFDEMGRPCSDYQAGERHGGQVRMSFRLARSHRDELRHVHALGWLHWCGTHWETDEGSAHASRAVLDVLRAALTESLGDKQLRADVARCESKAGIEGVLGIAETLVEFATAAKDLDADPYMLNTPAGVLDLHTLNVTPHAPDGPVMTKITHGCYRADADTTAWEGFLTEVMPDADVRGYLQRIVGVALVGRVLEQVFTTITGVGANGKSVFTDAVSHALGSYATAVDPEVLLESKHGADRSQVMKLRGARFAVCQETNQGRRLDQAVLKRFTGGDKMTGRAMYRDAVEWDPTHTLMYSTNHLPEVSGNDPATWRRIRVVPFGVVIPPEHRNPRLTEELRGHADAIVTWAVNGWADYQRDGLGEPAAVLAATNGYRAESDDVARFLTDACVTAPGARALSSVLFAAWQGWARHQGVRDLTAKAFGAELDRLGYPAKKTKRGMERQGIGLPESDLTTGGAGW